MMRFNTVGIFAHVDSGKTTLCEALMFKTGAIRKLGRVDNRDAFLDTHFLERARGITIFSKQAHIHVSENREVTLLDTPGHVDFSSESERVVPVIDAAVFVISAKDGMQPHGETLWKILRRNGVPTIIFVTKMDLSFETPEEIFSKIEKQLASPVFMMNTEEDGRLTEASAESLALADETLLEKLLNDRNLNVKDIKEGFEDAKLFPVIFGSGLKLDGIEELITALDTLLPDTDAGEELGLRVYKIDRDDRNSRVTFMRVMGGILEGRQSLSYEDADGNKVTEKITGIRRYNGNRFETLNEAVPGMIVGVTGLSKTYSGLGIGSEKTKARSSAQAVFRYSVYPEDSTDPQTLVSQLRILEEEDPLLQIRFDEHSGDIAIQFMGDVQIEVFREILRSRFGTEIRIEKGKVLYEETIRGKVEGVGHYEPLRHYAEIHVIIKEAERGSGITYGIDISDGNLLPAQQRAVIEFLEDHVHKGVIGGFPLTDVSITLASGRYHLAHTEGGDLRQAALRAVRQGLMKAENVLLEPIYDFELTIPSDKVGTAIQDLRERNGVFELYSGESGMSVIKGRCPVRTIQGYSSWLAEYSSGKGRLSCSFSGFEECKDAEVLRSFGYDPESDMEESPDSVFCRHGAGHIVKWDKVEENMHLPGVLSLRRDEFAAPHHTISLDEKQVEEILKREVGTGERRLFRTSRAPKKETETVPREIKKRYLFLDGYNVLFGWPETARMAEKSIDAARGRLLDIMAEYHAYTGMEVMVVFDAYLNNSQEEKRYQHYGVDVVFTDNKVTADAYLEKISNEIGKNEIVTVVSSDNLVRIGVFRSGIRCESVSLFVEEIERFRDRLREDMRKNNRTTLNRLEELIGKEELEKWNSETN
jgi:small GTP-binding protein